MGNTGSYEKPFLDDSLPRLPFYTGKPIQFHHLIFNTYLDEHVKQTFSTIPDLTYHATSLEEYYPKLGAMYEQGFRMVVFLSLPAGFKRFGMSNDRQYEIKFQGVFRKESNREMSGNWQLHHTRSKFVNYRLIDYSFTHFSDNRTADIEAIKEVVQSISDLGGKVLCIEITTLLGLGLEMKEKVQKVRKGQNAGIELDVEIFYEKRLDDDGERYMYEFVSCSLESSVKHSVWHTAVNLNNEAKKHLLTGWRIADIFVDHSSSLKGEGFAPKPTETTNCYLIFEKPVSLSEDMSARFEVTWAEKWFKTVNILHGFKGAEQIITTDWENLIDHYGKYGWEVIRIVKTRDERAHQESFTKYALYTRHLVFFQRELLSVNDLKVSLVKMEKSEIKTSGTGVQSRGVAEGGAGGVAGEELPPSYEEVLKGNY